MAAAKMFFGICIPLVVCFLSWCPVPSVSVLRCPDNMVNCTTADLCPPKCRCDGNTTDCSQNNLTHLPEAAELNGYTRVFRISYNQLPTLWRTELPHLREFFADHNDLKYLRDDAFIVMPYLTLLDISYNDLDEVSERPLQYLKSLLTLDISHNNIKKLTKGNFDGSSLRKLVTLDLSYNAISIIENEAFVQMINLQQLKLCHNRVKVVSQTMFRGVTSLSMLYLDHNYINHIDDRSFLPLSNLSTLTLNHNDLPDLDRLTFFNLHKLESLDLGYNMLKGVPSEALREMPALRILNLDGNKIVNIEKEDFPIALRELRNLYLSDMATFKDIQGNSLDDFKKLRLVNISRNPELSSLHHHIFFASYHELRVVDLSRNALTEVDQSLLPWDLLFTLGMAGNKWRCDCQSRWMRKYKLHKYIKCDSPEHLAGTMYADVTEEDLCATPTPTDSKQGIRNALAITALVVSVLLIGFLVYRFRGYLPCYKKPGTYNTLYNIYDPTRENSNNVVIKYRGDEERVDSKTTGVDMDNEMKAIL